MASRIRLFVDQDLQLAGELEILAGQLHYLKNVMRLGPGDSIALFNGRDGEFLAEIIEIKKKIMQVRLTEQTREQISEPDLWLLFAPVKKSRIDMIAEKATELGAAKLLPVMTDHTHIERVKIDRLRANAIEAAEQCRRLTVPEVIEPQPLNRVLDGWDPVRRLLVMDETSAEANNGAKMSELKSNGPSDAILIGPEGGFSASELDLLDKLPFVTKVSLGGRILRAETAAVVALALWNELVAPKI